MKCEECLLLLDDYVEGDLGGRTAARVAAHLRLCAACAREAEELRREQECYLSYRREVCVTPELVAGVLAAVGREKAARAAGTARRAGLAGRLAELFVGTFRRPAPAAALVLLAAVLGAWGLQSFVRRGDGQGSAPPAVEEAAPHAQVQPTTNNSPARAEDKRQADDAGGTEVASRQHAPQKSAAGPAPVSFRSAAAAKSSKARTGPRPAAVASVAAVDDPVRAAELRAP